MALEIGTGDEIIPKLVDPLHELTYFPIRLLQIGLTFADQLPHSRQKFTIDIL